MRTLTWGNVEMSDIHNHEQARGDRLCVDNLPFRVGACGQLEGAGENATQRDFRNWLRSGNIGKVKLPRVYEHPGSVATKSRKDGMSKIDDSEPESDLSAEQAINPLRIPKRQLDFLDAAERLEQIEPIERNEIGYSARLWAQLSLPYQNPGDLPKWQRRNGDTTLTMYPAELRDHNDEDYSAYPFGLIPRYLLIWMVTEAVRTGSRKLFLGENLSQFMKKLGLSSTGGKTGSIRQLNEQMRRLFGSTLKITEHTISKDLVRERGANMNIASEWDLFFSRFDPDDAPLFESSITLSEEFYKSLEAASIPIDLGAVNALRKNRAGPMALDIYVWLCARLPRVPGARPSHIPWGLLAKQFGSDTSRLIDFRRKFLKRLKAVEFVYPEARIEADSKEIILFRSPPSVPMKDR